MITASAESARAADVKGHVSAMGEAVDGFHPVSFDIRHGDSIHLRVASHEKADIAKLEASLAQGACVELFYEDRPVGRHCGTIIIVH